MMFFVVLILGFCLQFNDARVVIERSNFGSPHANGWTKVQSQLTDETVCDVTFVLAIRNEKELDKEVKAISDPDSPRYTNYLTLDQIVSKYSPSNQTIIKLENWIRSFPILSFAITLSKDFITIKAPVSSIEKMFQVKMGKFYHSESKDTLIRTNEPYTLPFSIAPLVSLVSGINHFPSPMNKNLKIAEHTINRNPKKRQATVTPQVVWQTFNTEGVVGNNSKNLQGCAQFLQQYYLPSDLASYQQIFNLQPNPISKVIGPNDQTNPGMEATLDVQLMTGTAPQVSTWFYSTPGTANDGQERFLLWAQGMNNASLIPFVVSVSYGDTESSISDKYIQRLEIEFKKLALRGTTILFSSGDDGVGCTNNCVNAPNWPATSPLVTAVGGFYGSVGGLVGDSISSGGFSNAFTLPYYQKSAVMNYLANSSNNIPPASQFNAAGRAVPDLAAFSEGCAIIYMGSQSYVGGTSCASPTVAGIITLINDYLFNNGKRQVGYMNPAIYKIAQSTPKAFLDITSGNNVNGCCNGFQCASGWDPVTGFGAPNFQILKRAFISLQK